MEPEISVVVPLRNESANVLPLAERIFAALDKASGGVELILVDDASSDDTWQQILKARQTHPRLRAFRHSQNRGQSAALWTGFKVSHGKILATLDGDLQNDPADLPRMLALLADCDMVCGVRTNRADNWLRRVSSSIARSARKTVLGMDFADTGCNLRVFKRTVLETLPAFDGIHRFMPVFVHNVGLTVKELPVSHHPRTAGRSNYGISNRLGRGIRDLIMVRWFLKRQIDRAPVEKKDNSSSLLQPKPAGPGSETGISG
jgi:glycosyltransferase involved in cell wall biosynthesis